MEIRRQDPFYWDGASSCGLTGHRVREESTHGWSLMELRNRQLPWTYCLFFLLIFPQFWITLPPLTWAPNALGGNLNLVGTFTFQSPLVQGLSCLSSGWWMNLVFVTFRRRWKKNVWKRFPENVPCEVQGQWWGFQDYKSSWPWLKLPGQPFSINSSLEICAFSLKGKASVSISFLLI